MAKTLARLLTFKWNTTTLVGVKSRAFNMSNSLIDVTTDDDSGWQTLLATPGFKAVEITLGIIVSDEILIAEMFNASVTGETLLTTLPTGAGVGNVTGTFMLSALNYSGDTKEGMEISATFMSSGTITYSAV